MQITGHHGTPPSDAVVLGARRREGGKVPSGKDGEEERSQGAPTAPPTITSKKEKGKRERALFPTRFRTDARARREGDRGG